jgi:hypothetical protein
VSVLLARRLAAAAIASTALCVGCAAHLTTPGGTVPTPAPSGATSRPSSLPSTLPTPSSSASPQPCLGQQGANDYIAMSFGIAPASSDFGILFGYAEVDASGQVPTVAAPILLSPGDRVQFVNLDGYDQTQPILRSAAVFPNVTAFPPLPYTWPSNAYGVVGTTLNNTFWSTGLIQPTPSTGAPCYSQVFTAGATGTYYFGDVLYYDDYIASPRGVLSISP